MQTNPDIFKKNYEALQKYYPDLALMLSTVKVENHKIIQQGNNLPNLIIDGQAYYIGNITEYFEEQMKGFELDNVKIPMFLGFGLGYEVMYWMQHKSKKYGSQAIIIIERDPEIFMAAMNIQDLTPIITNPRIHLFIGVPLQQMYIVLREHFRLNIQEMLMAGAIQPIFLYPNMRKSKDYYLPALQTLFETIYHNIQNYGNSAEDSLIGLENMLDNVNEIVNNPGINLLYDKFKGKPAIIVATGPSLKKNMHLLKGLEDKALIISVDASFKYLMKNGIKPHMVTSLEREHVVQQLFDNFDKEDVKDVYMTACPVLYNHVYEAYNGPQIIVYRNFDHFKWLEIDRGILDIKLSSSNMAFKIAESLGCDPIILVGQDLAYGENDETHATEVPFSSEGEGIFYVKGNIAEKVKTNSGWYNFLKAFEFDIAQYNGLLGNNSNVYNIPKPILFAMKDNILSDQNIAEETKKILLAKIDNYLFEANANNKKVINATEGGAYIQGTEIASLDETIKKYITEKFDPLTIIQDTLKTFTSENVENDIKQLKLIIDKTENEVQEIINQCIKGNEMVKKHEDELKTDLSNERFTEIRKEIIQPREIIQTNYSDTFQRFLMHVLQSSHLKFEMQGAMIKEPKELMLTFKDWYSYIGDISEICLQSLKKAKDKLYAEKK